MIEAGLRVDVDTFRGTRDGVPKLLRILDKHDIRASFFFSVGPDNMGRHVWRLFRPRFLRKMLRSQAASLYGWDILLAGTLWPGRRIGKRLAQTFRETDRCGHEIGLHAWDHHAWQARAGHWGPAQLKRQIRLGMHGLSDILGRRVDCSATAGWRTVQSVVDAKETFGFRYNSDCRGTSIFRPTLADGSPGTPQIPVSLPTFDEVIGCDSGAVHFNDFILDRFHSEQFNVYTVHAEVEGGIEAGSFDDLLKRARARGIYFKALGELLPDDVNKLPSGRIVPGQVMGREGWIGTQACG